MKLWILEPVDPKSLRFWRHYVNLGFVVRARTEDEARKLASGCAADEDRCCLDGTAAWICPSVTKCEELTASGEPGVILVDFHAG